MSKYIFVNFNVSFLILCGTLNRSHWPVKLCILTKNSGGLDIINIEYKLYALRLQLCLIMLNKKKHTYIYIESLVKYVVSVIDYNISLFRTASRSNYAIINYTMLQSASIVIFRNGIFHWPVKRINLIL